MRVKQLQAGGYLAYQPLPQVPQQQVPDPQQQQAAGGQPPEEEGYLDKSILEKMLGKGITTDVMQYSNQLQSAYQQYQGMSELQRNSYKGRQIRSMLKGDFGQLNALIRAKDTFDDALKNIKSKEGLDELAVTSSGVVAQDKETGKINSIGFAEYAKNKDKYQALTNAELAQQREYNDSLRGNSNVFSILNFGTGMSEVKKEVYLVASHISKSGKSEANGEFTTTDAENMKDLAEAAKTGAFKTKSASSITTNRPQLRAAQETMWLNLSPSAKAVLRARASTQVDSPEQIDELAKNMAASLLSPEESTMTTSVFDESMIKGSKGSKGAGADKQANYGPYLAAYNMANDTIPLSQIGPSGVKIDGFASAVPVDAYTDKDNNRVALANAGKLNNISYLSKAFVANGDKVDPTSTVITGDAYMTILPYTKDENGNFKIDEEGSKRYAQYQEAAKHSPQDPATDAKLRAQFGVANLTLGRFVVAEASSYDTKNYFSGRDKGYYEDLDSTERNKLGEIVDPKHNTVHHALWTQNDAHKHLVFIPAKNELSWTEQDGNHAKVPESAYGIQNGFNSVGTYNAMTTGTPLAPANAQKMGLDANSFFK